MSDSVFLEKENWPVEGKRFLYKNIPQTRSEQDRFKDRTGKLGFPWESNYEPDHVLDLQFGGWDSFLNLWPLPTTLNHSAGGKHLHERQKTAEALGKSGDYYVVIRKIEK